MNCGSFIASNPLTLAPQHPGMNIFKYQQQELLLKQQQQQQQQLQHQHQRQHIRYNGETCKMAVGSSECGMLFGDAIVKEEPRTFEFTEKGRFLYKHDIPHFHNQLFLMQGNY